MKKAKRWIIRILKCLICVLTGAYRDNDYYRDNGDDGNESDNRMCEDKKKNTKDCESK